MTSQPRLLLFDLYQGGHHAHYLRVVADRWADEDRPGFLDLVVSPAFAERNAALLDHARAHPGVRVHPTAEPVELLPKMSRRAVFENDLRIGPWLKRSVETLRPDHTVLLYFDHLQASLATGLRFPFPTQMAGVYFRPSFHYRALGRGPVGGRAALEAFQKKTLLRFALRNPHLTALFCLDPHAVQPVSALAPDVRVVPLPEAFETHAEPSETAAETRRRLGVADGRKLLLLFGSLDPRKGAVALTEALAALPEALGRRATLVLAGEAVEPRSPFDAAVLALAARGTVQVIHLDGFTTDDTMHQLFGAADLVVLPYQGHVGSSGVLVRAAAAGAPVLGPSYGLLGAHIRDHGLGQYVDTTQPEALARGLAAFLDPASPFPFSAASARAFAAANTDAAMARTVLHHVLGPRDAQPSRTR